jgi:anti-sigma regulatory factor (Ser/Thr protein kinase)
MSIYKNFLKDFNYIFNVGPKFRRWKRLEIRNSARPAVSSNLKVVEVTMGLSEAYQNY